MTMVYVSQLLGDERVELAVRLDGDGAVAGVMQLVVPVGGEDYVQPLDDELAAHIDWRDLEDEARAALTARLRGWP